MAVAAPARPGHNGARSPTLSDAGMILPAAPLRSLSPDLHPARPPSPPALRPPAAAGHVQLALAPQARRRVSPQPRSPALSSQSSRSTLRTMADAAPRAKHALSRADTLASSPTVHHGLHTASPKPWTPQRPRRASGASSTLSDDLDNWRALDAHDAFDDSGLGLEEQEKHDHFPGDKTHHDDLDPDAWLGPHSPASDHSDDPYSSAALSRRAEIILANAKKRLNVMEGNLRGARESLVTSPTFGSRSASQLSLHISSTRERDRRLYAGLGPIPPRMPSLRSATLSANGSPGHARGLSETSVPLPFSSPTYMARTLSNKRAASATGHNSGPWSPDTYGQGRFPIKESRSFEVVRSPREPATINEPPQWPVRTISRNSKSSPILETLKEDDHGDDKRVHRSTSAASGLRDQMNDLKGRISSLKLRAQEDQLRRRSTQSLRNTSPFTNAQEWCSGPTSYHAGGAPATTNAGLGIMTESLTQQALYEAAHGRTPTPDTTYSQREGEKLVNQDAGVPSGSNRHGEAPYHHGADDFDDLESYDDEKDFDETDESDYQSVNGDDADHGAESVYEDAVYEMTATERHEDRVDAFDYEHFFLHSAMGTYSLEGRRSSIASDSSTATTRPVTAMQVHCDDNNVTKMEKRLSYHGRNPSSDSVSTVGSFATAAENQSDEDEEEEEEEDNEQMDQFSEQLLAQHNQQASAPRTLSTNKYTSLRSDSAINMRRTPGISPPQTTIARGSASPADLACGLQVSKMFSILTETGSPTREEPRLALSEEEKQLIYSLASSFHQVCSNLQHTYSEQYDRKAWRRRLDEARRVLDGEKEEDDDSF
ncbi:hypothetical protein ACEQ8H_003771 [Pleosporales sp. CAS-2024a]